MITSRLTKQRVSLASLFGLYAACAAFSANAGISQLPLTLVTSADPNILINLSVETPMGGAAYNDQDDTASGGSCSGRSWISRVDGGSYSVGTCYDSSKTYLGYFDSDKCYTYSGSEFTPNSDATAHVCSGEFSGNFMNWSTMTAMDMFVLTMTGGNRTTDSTSSTIIERVKKQDNDSWYPYKVVSGTRNVAPSTVTPWSDSTVYIYNTDFGVRFSTELRDDLGSNRLSSGGVDDFNLKVKVCDASKGLEENCIEYDNAGTPYYKPEGLMQRNAANKRFAATSYLQANNRTKDGGVLRAPMKYVGPDMPQSGGFGARVTNPNAEYGTDGLLNSDPDGQSGSGGVTDSGVINYINKFSRSHGYKSYDPVSELFYESLRYFRGQSVASPGPTTDYLAASDAERGGFPAYTSWDDPIQNWCQKNFIVGINDANPWRDKKLPGTHFTASTIYGHTIADSDYGTPSNPDTWFEVKKYTNEVGSMQSLNGTTQCVGCVSGDCTSGTTNLTSTDKTMNNLGEVFGTCPYSPKENSYYVAGLAYQANTEDMRDDFINDQTVTTFMIDTQEYSTNPLTGEMNPLWLAGKYGGFDDKNGDGEPDTADEWDADGDGEPDNYVLATNPSKMVTALNNTFAEIEKRDSSSSAVVANSVRLHTGTKIFQARFNSGEWSGELLSFPIDLNGNVGSADWNAKTVLETQAWNTGRNIFSFDPDAKTGIPFDWTSLTTAQQTALDINPDSSPPASDSNGQSRLEFIRGNRGEEAASGGIFRDRAAKLGDLVNSAPVYVSAPNFFYSEVLEDADCALATPTTPTACYSTFKAAHADRGPIIYVGGNDGMLHAFNAEQVVDTNGAVVTEAGEELMAYVPAFLIPGLNQLTSQDYIHQYYVDGNPTSVDAYFDTGSGSAWHTVLVGGARAGGQGYYALDITDPSDFGEDLTNAATLALWEFTDADDADLGFTYSQPAIVRMANDKWAVIFGNGYENTTADGNASTTGHAVLYILFMEEGLNGWGDSGDFIKIDTGVGTTGAPNGIATPAPVDLDGDGNVDVIYAGDLEGNLWKFDVSGANTNQWDDAGSRSILFTATDSSSTPQPITVRPDVGTHPNGGVMVYFGTGKYFEDGDNDPSNYGPQTFWAIWDDGASVSKSDLLEQKIVTTVTESGTEFRTTTNKTIDWTNDEGWYLDLTDTGEMVVVDPVLNHGIIIFITQVPTSDPCDFGGYSWLMEMDAVTGGWPMDFNLDVNNDGIIDAQDVLNSVTGDFDDDGNSESNDNVKPTGKKSTQGILTKPTIISAGRREYKYSSGSQGGIDRTIEAASATRGRQSWEQIR